MWSIAEAFGALAVIINFIGYRQNSIFRYRLISGLALLALTVHFFLLGAFAAAIACGLSVLRNLVALKTTATWVVVVFVGANFGFWGWEWSLGHGWEIHLVYTSTLIFTLGTIMLSNVTRIRQLFIVAESLGLTYCLVVGSVFGTVFNVINLSSIIIKLIQDRLAGRKSMPTPSE